MKIMPFTLLALLFAGPLSAAAAEDSGLLRKQSPHSVEATVERFEAAVRDKEMKVFTPIDHAAAARDAGLKMRPTVVVPFGNPRYGTPLMEKSPSAAIDFPPKVVIYEAADGQVWIEYNSAEYFYGTIFARHGLAYTADEVAKFAKAVDTMTDVAVKPDA